MRIVALALLLVSACMGSSAQQGSGPAGEATTIAKGSQSGIRRERQFAARTPEEWERVWSEHSRNVLPPPQPPAVDWTRDMVLGVVLGDRPSGGYSVNIAKIEGTSDGLRVWAAEIRPVPGAMQAAVVTSPFHLVSVPRHAGKVEFKVQ